MPPLLIAEQRAECQANYGGAIRAFFFSPPVVSLHSGQRDLLCYLLQKEEGSFIDKRLVEDFYLGTCIFSSHRNKIAYRQLAIGNHRSAVVLDFCFLDPHGLALARHRRPRFSSLVLFRHFTCSALARRAVSARPPPGPLAPRVVRQYRDGHAV